MSRKTHDLRLSQTNGLIEEYKSNSLIHDYRYRFICDMKSRLDRRKGLSTKQRSWLDALIEEGAPASKGDPELVAKIDLAINTPGMETSRSVLTDFLSKIKRGYNLSEKQTNWMNAMLVQAEEARERGPYVPTPETIKKLEQCVEFSRGYSQMFWSTHSASASALNRVREWLNYLQNPDAHPEAFVDEWAVNKLLKAMGTKLRELNETPYAQQGQCLWFRKSGQPWTCCLVVGEPKIDTSGRIVYPILVDGNIQEMPAQSLSKRKPKQ